MNKAPLVLITDRFDEELLIKLPLLKNANFVYLKNLHEEPTLLAQAAALIVRSGTTINADFLAKVPQLQFIVTATSGFDHLDLAAIKARGIRCFHTPETQAIAAAEMTLLLLLSACRKYDQAQRQMVRGDWQRHLLLGRQLAGQTLGIVGLGRVGTAVAERARALGMQVLAYDPYLEEHNPNIPMMGYEEMMRTVDVVSFHVPFTKITRHMIKKETLAWMNRDTILINMSRGEVVHEFDLIQHLAKNPQFIACLDVFAKEPLATDSPFFSLSNVVLAPHIGASTKEAIKQSSQAAVDKVSRLFNGETVQGELPPQAGWYDS